MRFAIATDCFGVLTLTDERGPWTLLAPDGRALGPEDMLTSTECTTTANEPARERARSLVATWLWIECEERTPEECIAANAYLRLEERQAEERATRPQREREARERLATARNIGDGEGVYAAEEQLEAIWEHCVDDLVADLKAADAEDDPVAIGRLEARLREMTYRREGGEEYVIPMLGAERAARLGITY
jgi:hypothetical protein